MEHQSAAVITVSDGVSNQTRTDESGPAVAARLLEAGFDADIFVVPDEREVITELIRDLARNAVLVVTTGGTGFSPRDVTPEATLAVLEREAPGLAEAMRAAGRLSTPFADLSRGVCGIVGGAIVLNLPGSPKGAIESLDAVMDLLPHALAHLRGDTEHNA